MTGAPSVKYPLAQVTSLPWAPGLSSKETDLLSNICKCNVLDKGFYLYT